MGFRRDIEEELFPDKVFTSPVEVYFAIANILVDDIAVEFPNASVFKEDWGDRLDKAKEAARMSLVTSLATEACFSDFSQGNDEMLSIGAENVRLKRLREAQ